MNYLRARLPHQSPAGRAPAVAEFAILACDQTVALEKSPASPQRGGGKSDVVGREKQKRTVLFSKKFPHMIGKKLAGNRIGITVQAIRNPAADAGLWVCLKYFIEGVEPVVFGNAIIVSECDVFAARHVEAGIACRGGAGVGLAHNTKFDDAAEFTEQRLDGLSAAVIHDYHFET